MSPQRVLLTDDDDLLRRLYATALIAAGHVVVEATDGMSLLAAANDGDFDVLVTDVMMPGISGLEAALKVKAQRPHMKVIVVTAFVDAGVAARAASADFILRSKPLHPRELVALINE
jgi:two-component system, cell cycle response regulator CpdR